MEHKVVPVTGFKVIDDARGIVGAFVSVTGAVDSVKDRILPGAYEKTLVARTPKGVWSHNWDQPISRTLSAEEILPGDDRLPTKTRTGADWPANAGALYVETQFNIGDGDNEGTQRARDAFSDVKFFGEDQEWSIGYNVPLGASKVDPKTGVRELSALDLYEYSPVLFGAMSLTATAGVKDAQEEWKARVKAGDATEGMVVVKDGEEAVTEDAPAPGAEGAPVATGFTEVTEDTPITTPADPIHQATGGSTGAPAGVEVEPRPTVEGPPGDAEVTPAKSAASFNVGLTEAGQAATDAVKAWALEELAKPDVDAVAVLREATKRQLAIMDDPANVSITPVEEKAFVTLAGSYEERQEELREALPAFLAATFEDIDVEARDEYGWMTTWVSVEATFNARVVAVVYDLDSDEDPRYFDCTYSWDPAAGDAVLKTAREVIIQGVVVPKSARMAAEMKAHRSSLRRMASGAPEPVEPPKTTPPADDADPAPEGEATMVTLTEADLLLLERLKLDA